MKISSLIAALILLPLFGATAQVVTVQVTMQQSEFLPGETMPVTVRVENNSGQTLHLGADSKWLTFDVESLDSQTPVQPIADPPVIGPFDLGSSELATKTVDLAPCFALNQPGSYNVTATVHIHAWGTDTASPPVDFDIVQGAELWSEEFGVPVPPGVTNRMPEIRKFTLEEANYLRRQLRLYVMVTDPTGARVIKVDAVGPMVSFSRPEAQLDRLSNLHVLYQCGAQSFLYSVVNPNGIITQQDIYDYFGTRPRLALDAAGDIIVKGGVRRVRVGEVPPVKPPDELTPAPPPPAPGP